MTTKKIPTALASGRGFFGKFFGLRAKCWLCRKICCDEFFNRDASREIDRLTIELEKIRAAGKA